MSPADPHSTGRFRPIQVTATLPFGIALGRPWGTSLDGLLAAVLWDRAKASARSAGHHLAYDPDTTPPDQPLPLARCTLANTWHWAATFADITAATDTPDIRIRTRRTDHQGLQQLSPTIPDWVSDTRGRYRARSLPAIATVTTTATWRAVGDPDAISDVLADLHHIGKHRGTGEGHVTGWSVTTLADCDPWEAGHLHADGTLGRSTPPACLANHRDLVPAGPPADTAVRAPYIHPSRITAAFLPAH